MFQIHVIKLHNNDEKKLSVLKFKENFNLLSDSIKSKKVV